MGDPMSEDIRSTDIWQDALEMPEALQTTLDDSEGFADVVSLLCRAGTRRIVASGNGASYYVAQALWLAALEGDRCPLEVAAVPGGLLAKGGFRWREGDVLLAISSSGEFRDVIEAIESPSFRHPFAAVTSMRQSTIGATAGAGAVVKIPRQRAVTHTQAFCGAVLTCLSIWADISSDDALRRAVAEVPGACERALRSSERWADEKFDSVRTPSAAVVFGTRTAWAAALEGALLIKEIGRIPCEGVETREGATSAMTALNADHLALSLPTLGDDLIAEAEEICGARGAQVLRAPGGLEADRRASAITVFPASLALSVALALRAGWDADNPEWNSSYFTTARRPS
jgi:fructoselysine-6-P-deglycase FrlB-like protein